MNDQTRTSDEAEAAPTRPETSVIEMGPPVETPRSRNRAAVFLAVFALGIVVGLVIDQRITPAPAARLAPSVIASPPAHGEVVLGLATCAATNGSRLDIGMKITNYATVPVMLTGATITLPQHGLRLNGTGWTECGDGPALAGVAWVAPGASGWISGSTEMTGCLDKPVITFAVSYLEQGQPKSLPATTYDDTVLPDHTGTRSAC